MLVKWNRSIADTQLNFKGYFLKLYKADTTNYYQSQTYDTTNGLLDTVSIFHLPGRITDTFYTFDSIPKSPPSLFPKSYGIPVGTYAVDIYGLKTDTTQHLSLLSSFYVGLFDPLPLQNPTNLQATSTGANTVELHWTLPVTDKDTGFYQYVVYYRDTTITDTGHVVATIPKGPGDTIAFVSVPPLTGSNVTATEYPYEFWVKSERNDSTFFYGPDALYGPDTNHIVWAGAELCPKSGSDTSGWNTGFLLVPGSKSAYFGSLNLQFDLALDTSDSKGQFIVDTANGIVTLKVQGPDGIGFLNRIDYDSTLSSVFYSGPLNDPTQFEPPPSGTGLDSISLPLMTTKGGAIVYLMMNDDETTAGHMWGRILIHAQQNGSFINSAEGGVDVKGSYQPGEDKSGTVHLPFY